ALAAGQLKDVIKESHVVQSPVVKIHKAELQVAVSFAVFPVVAQEALILFEGNLVIADDNSVESWHASHLINLLSCCEDLLVERKVFIALITKAGVDVEGQEGSHVPIIN